MTRQRDTDNDDRTDRDARLPADELRRRDVVKAVGGAVVGTTALSDAATARTTFCGTEGCTAVEKPPEDVYTVVDDRTRVEFERDYLDAKMDEGYDTLGVKSGSCSAEGDGNGDCDYVGLNGCTYSYGVPDSCNDVGHPELLKCGGESYAVEQADTCTAIEPLSDGDVVDLFGYTSEEPRETNLPAQLEAAQKSRLFLYEGPEGLSLVVVHGGTDAEQGGAATFRVTGLPSDGEFVVLADRYEGSEDEFDVGDREAVLNWSWGGTNDGGVFRGLGAAFCVRIEAAWNDEANLDPYGSGTVRQWQFLSGSLDDPEVVDLDMGEPITVRSGGCGRAAPVEAGDHRTDQQDEGDGGNEEDEEGRDGAGDEENGGEYTVCHRPPGNPDNSRTITVGSKSALEAHLAHGDSRGPCDGDT